MRIVLIIAQVAVFLVLAYGGYWLYTWHQAHPGANDNTMTVQSAPADTPSERLIAQELIRQWMTKNLTDPSATIHQWSDIIEVRGNRCVVAAVKGRTRSGRSLIRTYAFEYMGQEIFHAKPPASYLESLESAARDARTNEEEEKLRHAIEHLKLIAAEISKDDTPE
jgi:hypothetical protein